MASDAQAGRGDRPVLNQVNLVVSDMEAAVAFYRRLGLEIPDTDAKFQQHHRNAVLPGDVDLDLDSHAFARHWFPGWRGGMGVIGFHVEERGRVDALYAELTGCGYAGPLPPHDAFWGARYAIVLDPDGNAVGIMSGIDPARRHPDGFTPRPG